MFSRFARYANLTQVQDAMIAAMLASKPGEKEHNRVFEQGAKAIADLGYTETQAWAAAYDAFDMAALERLAA